MFSLETQVSVTQAGVRRHFNRIAEHPLDVYSLDVYSSGCMMSALAVMVTDNTNGRSKKMAYRSASDEDRESAIARGRERRRLQIEANKKANAAKSEEERMKWKREWWRLFNER